MKMKHIVGLAAAGMCVFGAMDAYAQDSVAVMKIDAMGPNAEKASDALLKAIRTEVTNSDIMLDSNGSDITYSEMQMVTGCDKEGSIACYDAACEALGSKAIIFGNVEENGDAHIVWYVMGKGIFRETRANLTDKVAVDRLAKEVVVGEMGSVIVTSNVPGADVFIDGKRVGMSAEYAENAIPIELVTGNYVIAVRKDGFTKEDASTVTIEGGKVARVHVEMSVAKDPEEIRKAVLYSGYASMGVGAAAIIAASVVSAMLTYTYQDDFKTLLNTCGSNCKIDKKYSGDGLYHNLGISTYALFGVGGFFLAAGIAMTVTGFVYDFAGEDIDKAYSNKYMPKIDVSVTPEYQGMGLTWDF